jgi:Protein of unknown function (DUF3987)
MTSDTVKHPKSQPPAEKKDIGGGKVIPLRKKKTELSDIDTRKVRVTFFRDEQAAEAFSEELTLAELAGYISGTRHKSKATLPWVKMVVFGDKRTDKNSLRSNANVKWITGAEAEHDKGTVTFVQATAVLRKEKIRSVLYTSPSYQPGVKERWRILIPSSQHLAPAEREKLVARINGLFDGAIANESFTLSQAFYFGHVDNPHHRVEVVDGGFIDLRPDLDAGAIGKSGGRLESNPFTDYGDSLGSGRTDDELKNKLDATRKPHQWHLNMLEAIATMIGRDWSDFAIKLACAPYCRDGADDPDLLEKISSGRKKWNKPNPDAQSSPVVDAKDWPEPVDLWGSFTPRQLPTGLLPPIIEEFARTNSQITGADAAGFAMGALVVCAGAIPDTIELQVKQHDMNWKEQPRLWGMLIGDPSTKKSPIMKICKSPVTKLEALYRRQYGYERQAFEATPEDQRGPEPILRRIHIEDVTIESSQSILKDNPNGLLTVQFEMSGWMGGMDRYSGPRGGMRDRAFWLQAYDGGPYSVDRIGRGLGVYIPNLSVSLLGGIQPDLIRELASAALDDGLLQRCCPVILTQAAVGVDAPMDPVNDRYGNLVEALYETLPPMPLNNFLTEQILRFDAGAQAIRNALEKKHVDLQQCEAVSKKLSSHIGKFDGVFARLCIVWHCVEHAGRPLPMIITEETARRVAAFMHGFMLDHAVAFYSGTLKLSDQHDSLTSLAGFVLAHEKTEVTNRDVQQSIRAMRGLEDTDVRRIFEQLEALAWVQRGTPRRANAPAPWVVNPKVHLRFKARGDQERTRRQAVREVIAAIVNRQD